MSGRAVYADAVFQMICTGCFSRFGPRDTVPGNVKGLNRSVEGLLLRFVVATGYVKVVPRAFSTLHLGSRQSWMT